MQPNFLLSLSLLCCLSVPVLAQTQQPTPSGNVAGALSKQIHLSADMSLSQAMQSLSQQIGVEVQLADYLADRQLTASLEHVTAREALDALAELEDWQWKEDTAGRIRIERRPVHVPKEPAYIPRWIQAELPRDIRDFLNIPRPDEDPQKFHWAVLEPNRFPGRNTGKSLRLSIEQQRLAIEGHLPAFQRGEKVLISTLTPQEKRHLLLGLALKALSANGGGLFKGDLPLYASDPSSAIVRFDEDKNLYIGTYIEHDGGSTGAGFSGKVK